MARLRKNAWTLPVGDTTFDWYAKAVARMKGFALLDPRGWRYQAAVHGYPGLDSDPLRQPGDAVNPEPSFWEQCEHQTSFFLPWHRMYLLQFERSVQAHITALGGPADWALPYWDTYKNKDWRLLPTPFRDVTSPLYVAARNIDANEGKPFLHDYDVDLRGCLTAPGTTDIAGFFGDPAPNHLGGSTETGAIEQSPHNVLHYQLGRDHVDGSNESYGWMGDPDFAALDPIFWLHHANIDRLWQVWLERDSSHKDLASPYWLDGVIFAFNDGNGGTATWRTSDVLDLTATALDYSYEDLSDPLAVAAPAARAVGAPMPRVPSSHELVGASLRGVALGADVVHTSLPTPVTPARFAASRSATRPAALSPGPARVVLRLENITSATTAPAYDVYLNVPVGDDPAAHPELHAGRAGLFGIAQASRPGPHGGSGLSLSFDITSLYGSLSAAPGFDPKELRVSFVPVTGKASKARVHVGRVSLYFA